MPANGKQRQKVEEKRQRAWEMHTRGANQWTIAAELGVTQSRVSQLVKEAAASHPTVSLSFEERAALAEEKWNQGEALLLDAIAKQQAGGRQVVEQITFSDGTKQTKVTSQDGVDPALLRAFSTHIDRRNRQSQNQLSPDAGVNNVSVQVVQDFLAQGGGNTGKLSAADWNSKDDAVDVGAIASETDAQASV
jgi:predicted transcriptional regulator